MVYMQTLRLLPFISRLSSLFEREPLLTNSQDRANLQSLATLTGSALNQLILSLNPVTPLIRNAQIGHAPSQFRIINPLQTQAQQQQEVLRDGGSANTGETQGVLNQERREEGKEERKEESKDASNIFQGFSRMRNVMDALGNVYQRNVAQNNPDPQISNIFNLSSSLLNNVSLFFFMVF
jgi:hypothetical protein